MPGKCRELNVGPLSFRNISKSSRDEHGHAVGVREEVVRRVGTQRRVDARGAELGHDHVRLERLPSVNSTMPVVSLT